MKKILLFIVSGVLGLPLVFAGVQSNPLKNCSENGGCIIQTNGCTSISGIDELNCISQYTFANDYIVGITTSSVYFVAQEGGKKVELFNNQKSWSAFLNSNNIGPITIQDKSQTSIVGLLQKNNLEGSLKNVKNCFEVDGYLIGEAVNHEYFILNEQNRKLEIFTNKVKWQNQLADKKIQLTEVSWMSGLVQKSENLLKLLMDLNPIAICAILSLLIMNALFLGQLFSNFFFRPYRPFGVSFIAFEILLLVYFMVF